MGNQDSIHAKLMAAVRAYHIPEEAKKLLAEHPPLTISGITAAGKNSVTGYITQNEGYSSVITHTTRQPRPGEVNAHHYHFVSEEAMLDLLHRHAMIEVQIIHGDTVYGVSIDAYRAATGSGHKPLLNIDVQGVEAMYKYLPPIITPIFMLPPSFEDWMQWLEKRGRMSHTEKLQRMKSAQIELDKAIRSDLFLLVVNHELSRTAKEILLGSHDPSSQHHNREIALRLADSLKTI